MDFVVEQSLYIDTLSKDGVIKYVRWTQSLIPLLVERTHWSGGVESIEKGYSEVNKSARPKNRDCSDRNELLPSFVTAPALAPMKAPSARWFYLYAALFYLNVEPGVLLPLIGIPIEYNVFQSVCRSLVNERVTSIVQKTRN